MILLLSFNWLYELYFLSNWCSFGEHKIFFYLFEKALQIALRSMQLEKWKIKNIYLDIAQNLAWEDYRP